MLYALNEVLNGNAANWILYIIKATFRRIIDGKVIAHAINLILVNFACSCN